MPKKLEIARILTLSTCHIPENERKAAGDDAIYENEYGWVFWCGSLDIDANTLTEAPVLLFLKKWANKQGCNYLRLDADCEKCDDLPIFDW